MLTIDCSFSNPTSELAVSFLLGSPIDISSPSHVGRLNPSLRLRLQLQETLLFRKVLPFQARTNCNGVLDLESF